MCPRRLRVSERVFGPTLQFTEFNADTRTGDKPEVIWESEILIKF